MPRTCSICRSPRRHEIEADLQAGLSYLARRYNISKDAASRHRASHVSLHTTPALTTVTKIVALLDDAEAASTWNFSLLSIRETRRCFEELLRQFNVGIER
jgi:hypothetical protein